LLIARILLEIADWMMLSTVDGLWNFMTAEECCSILARSDPAAAAEVQQPGTFRFTDRDGILCYDSHQQDPRRPRNSGYLSQDGYSFSHTAGQLSAVNPDVVDRTAAEALMSKCLSNAARAAGLTPNSLVTFVPAAKRRDYIDDITIVVIPL